MSPGICGKRRRKTGRVDAELYLRASPGRTARRLLVEAEGGGEEEIW